MLQSILAAYVWTQLGGPDRAFQHDSYTCRSPSLSEQYKPTFAFLQFQTLPWLRWLANTERAWNQELFWSHWWLNLGNGAYELYQDNLLFLQIMLIGYKELLASNNFMHYDLQECPEECRRKGHTDWTFC